MRRMFLRRPFAPLLVALAVLCRGAVAGAVGLSISSATVAQPGDSTRLCVTLTTGGQQVAGTQNDLVWDGTCMTLNDGACFPAGNHGKQVNTRIQNSADFRMRVLVLSLSDVDPIDDGVLYCCNVQAEAEPGACCSIAVVNTGASDSAGTAVGGVGGNSGRVCVQGSGNTGGGAVGNVIGGQGFGAGNAAPAGDVAAPAVNAGAAGGGSGPAAAPAAQVLQGGGGGAQVPTAPAPVAAEPAVAEAPTRALPAATRALPAVAPTPPGAAAPAAAAAPTAAASPAAAPPTAPPTAAADTPTAAAATAVPTAVPPTRAPASTPTVPPATPTASRGWFGCQIAPGASPLPALVPALLLAAALAVRRFRRPRR